MTIYAGIFRRLAARAKAAAWFPELCVTTPFAACPFGRLNTAFEAPRNLKAPLHSKSQGTALVCSLSISAEGWAENALQFLDVEM